MFEIVTNASSLIFVVVSAVVGIRLLRLWRTTRSLPELALGAGLTLIVAVGYPLLLAGRVVLAESPETARLLLLASQLPMTLGYTAVWIFTWRVFRPDSRVAAVFCCSALALFFALSIGSAIEIATVADPRSLDFGSVEQSSAPFMASLSYLWGAVESGRYYTMMRKRLALGLADPVIANRFLLWTLVMTFALVSHGVPLFAGMMGIELTTSPPTMLTAALAGLSCAVALSLAFLPSEAYQSRIRARGPRQTATA